MALGATITTGEGAAQAQIADGVVIAFGEFQASPVSEADAAAAFVDLNGSLNFENANPPPDAAAGVAFVFRITGTATPGALTGSNAVPAAADYALRVGLSTSTFSNLEISSEGGDTTGTLTVSGTDPFASVAPVWEVRTNDDTLSEASETAILELIRVSYTDASGTQLSGGSFPVNLSDPGQYRRMFVITSDEPHAILERPTFDNRAGIYNESDDAFVTVTLDQPLPEDGEIQYSIFASTRVIGFDGTPIIVNNPIEDHDVNGNFGGAPNIVPVSAGSRTVTFTVDIADDNHLEPIFDVATIQIIRVSWDEGREGFVPSTINIVPFFIVDNDRVAMSFGESAYRVRDNAGTVNVAVNLTAVPIPETHTEMILDRGGLITLNSSLLSGPGFADRGPDFDLPGSSTTHDIVFQPNSTPSAVFLAEEVVVTIVDDPDDTEEVFRLRLTTTEIFINVGSPRMADVTIVPNTTGDYGSTSTTIALTEDSGTSVVRTLTLGHPPNSSATVSFELTGGTAAAQNADDLHALVFTVGGGATGLVIDEGGRSGMFTIPAGDSEVTLNFEAGTDLYGDNEMITFSITGITFADAGDVTDTPADALPPDLNIAITDTGPAAAVTADNDDTGISEIILDDSVVIRVRLTNIPSTATNAVIGFTLAGAATLSTDYTVTPVGSSASTNSVTITEADIDGNNPGVPQSGAPGRAEATLTFRALNDLAGIEDDTIELTIDSVVFEGAPGSNLAGADDIEGSSQTITIADLPTTTPLATLSVREAIITEGNDLSNMPNFRITLFNINSDTRTGTVDYEFSDGFGATASTDPAECAGNGGTTYCAFIRIAAGGLTGLTTQTGSFTFPVSSVSDEQPIGIFILSREDDDIEDETVELEITSVTVPQSDGDLTFSLGDGNLVTSGRVPVSTAQITIRDNTPLGVTRTEIDNAANIPEGGMIAVTVILNQPLQEDARLRYRIRAHADLANSIAAHDVMDGDLDSRASVPAPENSSIITFTVNVADDNRIEPTMERGTIEIFRLDLSSTQVAIASDNTADFTIEDNDKIRLSTAIFTITDNDQIRLSIAGRTVSENIGTLEYTVAAVAAAMPSSETEVVLDRAVTATLTSTGGSATAGADYDGLPAAIVFPANNVARAALTSTPPVSITINNNAGEEEQNFTLALASNDPAVEIADGTASTITIAPAPKAVFNGSLMLTFAEDDGPMTRTLDISNVPDNTTATVNFEITDGTASSTDDPLHDFILTVADHVSTSNLTFSGNNTNAAFTIPADRFVGGSTVITLTFTPIADTDSESEEITFGVANLLFPSNPIYNAGAQSPNLLITINEGALQLRIRMFLEGALQ